MSSAGVAIEPDWAQTGRVRALEGVRALAALSVVVHHVGANTSTPPEGFLGELVSRLDVGVTVFFVLSAYLILRPFVAADLTGAPRPAARAFWWNRAVRILPAYWVALVVLGLLGWIRFDGWAPAYPLLLQVYQRETFLQGITVAWSLCVEAAFYLLVPGVALAVTRWAAGDPARARRCWWTVAAGAAAVAVLFRAIVGITDPSWEAISFGWLPTHLDAFAAGLALLLLATGAEASPQRARLGARLSGMGALVGSWAAAAAVLIGFVAATPPPPGFNEEGSYPDWVASARGPAFTLVGVLVLMPIVLGGRRPGWLSVGPVFWAGSVSYAWYLWHLDLIRADVRRATAFGWSVTGGWALLVAVVGGLGVAWLSGRLVERPAARLRRPGAR